MQIAEAKRKKKRKQARNAKKKLAVPSVVPEPGTTKIARPSPLQLICDQVRDLCETFTSFLQGRSALQFVRDTCADVARHDPPEAALIVQGHSSSYDSLGLRDGLKKCHDQLLNMIGCGKELDSLRSMMNEVCGIVSDLKLLEYEAIVDLVKLISRLGQGDLYFLGECGQTNV
ncbi:hypothetical protein H1R20_g12901, partial [Candolleomyces eurysporus]